MSAALIDAAKRVLSARDGRAKMNWEEVGASWEALRSAIHEAEATRDMRRLQPRAQGDLVGLVVLPRRLHSAWMEAVQAVRESNPRASDAELMDAIFEMGIFAAAQKEAGK